VEAAVRAPHEHVEARAAPGARDRATSGRCAFDIAPFDPAPSVPPAVSEHPVGADGEHIDALGVAGRGGWLPSKRAAEGFPLVPALPVPITVPDLAVLVESEDLGLAGGAPRRGGGAGAGRAPPRGPGRR